MEDLESGQRSNGWERSLIERFAREVLREKRRNRRWGIFFKLAFLALAIAGLLVMAGVWDWSDLPVRSERHTALIEVNGVLESDGPVSADNLVGALQDAFKDKHTAGVVLRINSPGGSPVQAGIVYDEIRRQRQLHPKIPLYAVIEDLGASGAYYVAAAADRIYVDKASLVGSIGVLIDGFGFVGTIDKLGVERRLITAGSNKGFLDSFKPVSPEELAHAKGMLAEIHEQFIAAVRQGRGERLKADADVFNGLVWSGTRSIELGLADALGSVDLVARDVIKAEYLVDFSHHEALLDRLTKRFGASVAGALPASLGTGSANWRLR